MSRAATWEIVRTEAGYHLRLVGANGEPVATTEVYTTRETALMALSIIDAVDVQEFRSVDERSPHPDDEEPEA